MVECGSCGDNSRCMANQCTAVNQMFIALFDSLIVNADGSRRLTAVDGVCFYQPRTPPTPPTPTGHAGPCTAYQVPLQGGGTIDLGFFAGSAGTVTVQGALFDPIVLSPSGMTNGCYGSNIGATATQLFTDGAQLTISGSGGLDFPAFSMHVAAPPAIEINNDSIRRAAPLQLSWTGSDPGAQVSIGVTTVNSPNSESYIQCLVDDTSTYTIPASLTALLEPAASSSFIQITRNHVVHQEPASPSVVIQADISTSVLRFITYTP
jgi:hypothetical protein